jgi:hypothetical protein
MDEDCPVDELFPTDAPVIEGLSSLNPNPSANRSVIINQAKQDLHFD